MNQRKFPRTRLNRENTLAVGNRGHDSVQKGSLATRCRASDNERNAVTNAHTEKRDHFLGRETRFDEIIYIDSLRMKKSYRNRDAALVVDNWSL